MTFIKASDVPTISGNIEYSTLSFPTEEQVGIADSAVTDLQTPKTVDPINWFIFDKGEDSQYSPTWISKEENRFVFKNPGAYLNSNLSHDALNSELYTTGGPRNLGYASISDTTWISTNSDNDIWKEGSIEFTIKPISENGTILSGVLGLQNLNKSVIERSIATGMPNVPAIPAEIVNRTSNGLGSEKMVNISYDYSVSANGGESIARNNVEAGLTIVDNNSTFRKFDVKLVSGKIVISYEIFYGNNKKFVEFSSNNSIFDNEWHHVVINRPTSFTEISPGKQHGGSGCVEIWIDGKLDKRDYQITTKDLLPSPKILFNNSTNTGILNYTEATFDLGNSLERNKSWIIDEIKKDNYVGLIRDYIFRQSFSLSPHLVGINYVYSMLNDENSNIVKSDNLSTYATFVNPTVSVNSKKILKLYWNNLVGKPEKMVDGLELDEKFSVSSYSMTNKNLISPTQTFNIDLTKNNIPRVFLENVKTAILNNVYIYSPGMIQQGISGYQIQPGNSAFNTELVTIDSMDDAKPILLAGNYPWFVNNLEFGGVSLNPGDRILLTGQTKPSQNGIWIFNGPKSNLIRPEDVSKNILENAHVYIEDGNSAGKTFVQTEKVNHLRKSKQIWREIDPDFSASTLNSYPIHTEPWVNANGEKRFIDVNSDVSEDYDVIVFMNYPRESNLINSAFLSEGEQYTKDRYKDFINNLKLAIYNGKSIYVSSPRLAIDLGIVSNYVEMDQMFNNSGDEQSSEISPFEFEEPSENYFDNHRNCYYKLVAQVDGLTNKETYIVSDFVTHSPNKTNSNYHIKYTYRQNGMLLNDEFMIPGVGTVPETLNENLPGYKFNQKKTNALIGFNESDLIFGTIVTKMSNNIYSGDTAVQNPYRNVATTIIANYGNGKIFVNCVENGYAFSRSDYNTGIIQNVTIGQNSETALTAAWQYSTLRLNKKNLYDFSDISNLIGQTDPTDGGGGAIVQSQSHASNGIIRKNTTKGDLQYQSDLYSDANEEIFQVTKIPVLSMTWLGLQWLAE